MTSLDKKLLQTWKAQLRSWAREGDLLEASKRSLRLKKPPRDLKDWIESVSTGEDFKLPRITLLSSEAMQGAIGAYAGSTKTIYLNRQWINTAQADDAIAVLNEELGHYLDDKYNAKDTPGDEGRVFAQHLLHYKNYNDQNNFSERPDQGLIRVSGKWIEAELQNWTGIPGGDKYPNTSDGDDNSGNDSLNGGTGHDTIDGGNGKDTIHGQKGDDSIEGGNGNDSLHGGNDKDTISGGEGNVIKLEDRAIQHMGAMVMTQSMVAIKLTALKGEKAKIQSLDTMTMIRLMGTQAMTLSKAEMDTIKSTAAMETITSMDRIITIQSMET